MIVRVVSDFVAVDAAGRLVVDLSSLDVSAAAIRMDEYILGWERAHYIIHDERPIKTELAAIPDDLICN